jgi:hypothetical protein
MTGGGFLQGYLDVRGVERGERDRIKFEYLNTRI